MSQEVVIPEKIFFKIGEVCDILDVQAHVLRYWETEFPMLSPQKNRSGQRTYRRRDVEMALRIKDLLYDDLYTIAGAKKRLQTEIRDGRKPEIRKPSEAEDDMDLVSLEIDDSDSAKRLSLGSESYDLDDLDDEKKEALKSLVTELLELREMLKS